MKDVCNNSGGRPLFLHATAPGWWGWGGGPKVGPSRMLHSPPERGYICPCFVDPERGQRHVHGDQTLCVGEPRPPGELRERPRGGGLESRTGEGHWLRFLQ